MSLPVTQWEKLTASFRIHCAADLVRITQKTQVIHKIMQMHNGDGMMCSGTACGLVLSRSKFVNKPSCREMQERRRGENKLDEEFSRSNQPLRCKSLSAQKTTDDD